MSLSLYDTSVPVFTQLLTAASHNLDKAAAFAEAKKIDPGILFGSRLYPDMFPFIRQIQTACDNAKGASARIANVEIPRFADDETTIDQLKARIQKTIDFMAGLDRKAFDGAEERDVTLTQGGTERKVNAKTYLLSQALPNFFFHVTTAYAILRHNGVELGKRDYMTGQPIRKPEAVPA
jgi:hypothetical protein